MTRRIELDALRGLLLVMMTLTHLPTRLSVYSSQAFGFVSAAEGFVFLSGFVAGLVYWRGLDRHGADWMRGKLKSRALELYGWHLALLVFLFTVGAAIGHFGERPLLRNLLSFYFEQPAAALWAAPLLLYQPPLLDILPTYIVMLLLTPWWLTQARRHGWTPVLLLSVSIWLFAQVGGRALLLDGFNFITGESVPSLPLPVLGFFDDFAWQLLWVGGLWAGHLAVEQKLGAQLPRRSFRVAAVVTALLFLAWYHGLLRVVLAPLGLDMPSANQPLLFDKVLLRPLRVLNFVVLAVTIALALPLLSRVLHRAFGSVLGLLGRASLRVFAIHLFLALMAFGLIEQDEHPLDAATESLVLAATFSIMLWVAWRHQNGQFRT